MNAKTQTKKIWQSIANSGAWTLFVMFVWELVEEGLEALLAYTITSVTALFIVKALSTLFVIGSTQLLKTSLKTFLFPLIKKAIYKKGNDKIEFIIKRGERYMKWLNANKWSIIIGLIVGGVIGFGAYISLSYFGLQLNFLNEILIACSAGIVGFGLTFWLGHDTVLTFAARVNAKKLGNEKFAEVIKKAEELVEQIEKEEEERKALEKAKRLARKELLEKQEKEIELLAKQKLVELQKAEDTNQTA